MPLTLYFVLHTVLYQYCVALHVDLYFPHVQGYFHWNPCAELWMYCHPSKKRSVVPENPDDTETQSNVSQESSQIIRPSGSMLNVMGIPGSPFSTASVLGASFKSVSLEQGELKKTLQEKRKLEHELKMKALMVEKKEVEIQQLKARLLQVPEQFESKVKSLETERDYLFESAKNSKESLSFALVEIESLKEKLSNSSRTMSIPEDQERISELERTVRTLRLQLDSSRQTHQQAITETNAKLQSAMAEISEKNSKIDRLQAEVEEITAKFDEAQIHLLMSAKRASKDRDTEALQKVTFAKVNDAHQLELEHRKLVAENEQLKRTAGSAKILEERLRDLQFQLCSQRQIEQRLATLETENQVLKQKAEQGAHQTGPVSLKSAMEKTIQITKFQEELGELRGSMRAKDSEIDTMKAHIEQLRVSMEKSDAATKAKDFELSQTSEQLRLARLEILMLKDQLNPPVVIN